MRSAELLQRHQLAGTFYIPIRNSEGPAVLEPTLVRELARQFEIGSHTHDHCFLKSMDVDDAHYQITEGKKQLEDMLGHAVDGFCYPGGKFGRRDAEMVQSAGFRYARTTVNLCLDTGADPWEMPTTCQFYPHPRNVYLRNFARHPDWTRRSESLRVALRHEDWIARMDGMFDHACEAGGVFHLWWHSRDIEELQAWDKLDAFLGRVSSRLPRGQRVDNGRLAELCY